MQREKFGAKGEWWVVAQLILVPVALIADVIFRDSLPTNGVVRVLLTVGAWVCLITGLGLLAAGMFKLGSNLTALPMPIDNGRLIQTGVYGVVRHPIYAGVVIGMLGSALAFSNLVGLLFAAAIFLFFDQKSRREEVWLVGKYPGYPTYRMRVRKLIPFIY